MRPRRRGPTGCWCTASGDARDAPDVLSDEAGEGSAEEAPSESSTADRAPTPEERPGTEAELELSDPQPDVEVELIADSAPQGPPVTIAFAGDVMFEGMIRPQLDADPEGLLDPVAAVFADADLTVVNLETAITTGGTPAPKQFLFRAPPTALDALQAAGVSVASLANNHGMDFGLSGLEDTLEAADGIGFPIIGAGRDREEAFAPFLAEVRGRTIAVIAATQVMDRSFFDTWPATDDRPGLAFAKHEWEADLIDAVTSIRPHVDTVVVYLHWGFEGERCPSERQQGLARRLADAEVDIVVGAHAHRLQGAGMLDDTLVAYGLGNFVFYSRSGPGTETGVLLATVEGRDVQRFEWVPGQIRQGIPHLLEGDAASAATEAWEQLRGCTDLERR